MIPTTRYSPGSSSLIVGPGVLALTSDTELGRRLWPLISRGAGSRAVLEEALRDGLLELPDLVLVEVDGSQTRIVARGSHSAEVIDRDGTLLLCNGEDVSTWTEKVFDDIGAGRVDDTTGTGLPIVIGMVLASGFSWDTGAQIENSSTAPETAVTTFPGQPPMIEVPHSSVAFDSKRAPAAPTLTGIPPVIVPTPVVAFAEFALAGIDPSSREPARPGLAETRTEPADEGFDHLFGSTVYRSVEDAAVREVVEDPIAVGQSGINNGAPDFTALQNGEGGGSSRPLGDHDGSTILASELAALRQGPFSGPVIDSSSSSSPSAGPPLAVLVLSTGEQVALDRGVVIGRRPQVDRVAGSAIPRLVTVESPQQDISRSHLRITREAEAYVATDLHSMNGTVVIGADGASVTLGGGEPHPLRIGDLLDLGDGITISVRAAT